MDATSSISNYGPYSFGVVAVVVLLTAGKVILGPMVRDILTIAYTLRETSVLLNQALDKARALTGEPPTLRLVRDEDKKQ